MRSWQSNTLNLIGYIDASCYFKWWLGFLSVHERHNQSSECATIFAGPGALSWPRQASMARYSQNFDGQMSSHKTKKTMMLLKYLSAPIFFSAPASFLAIPVEDMFKIIKRIDFRERSLPDSVTVKDIPLERLA